VTATFDNGSAVTNNDAAVEVEVTKVEETVVTQVEEAVKADDNIEVVGTADNAVSVSATDSNTGAAQTNFVQPMAVSVPVDTTVLNNVEDTSKLTLAKVVTNEDGTTELVYMGGSYDKETGKFNAKVNEDGDYILVEKADLVKIELTIDDTTVKHNDAHQELDVAPVINAETGRTELPLSYLGDALGFEVLWDGETRTVTVVKGDISFSLTIGEEIPGYGTPYIDVNSDRTMVSASYISGMLGANVIWDPVDRQVIVVK
ncbi:MAG: copper amine oxidase N-terminal domain-containing protein, partial [Peptococcaceae bacterium]|nr:copper amine oxidase N-terminal domain-containing protein [Peptococcaceae bacterium]